MARSRNSDSDSTRTPADDAATSRAAAPAPENASTGTTNVVEAVEAGYLGVSPAREATGKDDKGLSQQTPEVMRRADAADVGVPAITRDALASADPVGGTADDNG